MSEESTVTLYTPVDEAAAAALGADYGELFESVTRDSDTGLHTGMLTNVNHTLYHVRNDWIKPVVLHIGDTVRFKSVASGREDVAEITRIDFGDDLIGLLVDGRTWWYNYSEIIRIVEKEETDETK